MSTNRNQKAYIRIDGSGRDVAGSLLLRNKKPGNGKWREVLAYECCNLTTTTTTANPAVVGAFKSGGIIASSTVVSGQVMIVDLNDLGSNIWNNGSNLATSANATALKTGEANTDSIISVQGAGTYAASVCRGGIIDWDLPSQDELNEVYVNRTVINQGITANGGTIMDLSAEYWTSTQNGNANSQIQRFVDGSQSLLATTQSKTVRGVRWVNI
tara:strand:- start:685 stop:1326 length:642 start_codon:yes stop_codon:yes gene_type:complete